MPEPHDPTTDHTDGPKRRRRRDHIPIELSVEEATELATQVARLSQAGLPLAPGLRALAEELGHGRLSRALVEVADALEAGSPLVEIFTSPALTLPSHVRALILAAIRSNRLPVALQCLVDIQRKRIELRHRMRLALAYPGLLMILLIAIGGFVFGYVVPQLEEMYRDFGAELPVLTEAILWLSHQTKMIVPLISLAFCTWVMIWLMPSGSIFRRMLFYVPLLGPLRRWTRLAECAQLIAMFIEMEVPLHVAVMIAGESVSDRDFAGGCSRVAMDLCRGKSINESFRGRWPFPETMIPMVQWGQGTNSLAEAFQMAAEMFEGRARIQCALLETVLVPLFLLLLLLCVGLVLAGLMLPMINLIRYLT